MALLRSEEQEEMIRFYLRHSPALRDFLIETSDRFQLAGLAANDSLSTEWNDLATI